MPAFRTEDEQDNTFHVDYSVIVFVFKTRSPYIYRQMLGSHRPKCDIPHLSGLDVNCHFSLQLQTVQVLLDFTSNVHFTVVEIMDYLKVIYEEVWQFVNKMNGIGPRTLRCTKLLFIYLSVDNWQLILTDCSLPIRKQVIYLSGLPLIPQDRSFNSRLLCGILIEAFLTSRNNVAAKGFLSKHSVMWSK